MLLWFKDFKQAFLFYLSPSLFSSVHKTGDYSLRVCYLSRILEFTISVFESDLVASARNEEALRSSPNEKSRELIKRYDIVARAQKSADVYSVRLLISRIPSRDAENVAEYPGSCLISCI